MPRALPSRPPRRPWPVGRLLAGTALLIGALLAPGFGVTAEPMADPTRPPSALLPAAAPRAAAASASAPAPRPAAPLPMLQAVLRPASGNPTAMIDGRVIQIGDAVGDWTLQAIQPDAVLLRNGSRQLRLPLLAGLNRPPAGAQAAPPAAPAPTATSPVPPEIRQSAPTGADPLALALPKEP